jgi:hypothetical protein
MDYSALLEIVISLAAMFWLLSMVCSFVVEAINSFVRNVRAEALERFIVEMVLGTGPLKLIYAELGSLLGKNVSDPLGLLSHGLITSLRKPSVVPSGPDQAPSYVPAEIFAKVILDRLASLAVAGGLNLGNSTNFLAALALPGVLNVRWQARMAQPGVQQSGESGLLGASAAIVREAMQPPAGTQPVAHLQDLLRALEAMQQAAVPPGAHEPWLGQLISIVEALLAFMSAPKIFDVWEPDPAVVWCAALLTIDANPAGQNVVDAVRMVLQHGLLPKVLLQALRPIVANANFDLAQIRKGTEDWYNAVMERATGWFKRHTAAMLAGCGLVFAIALNINPIAIAQDLARDPELRREGVAFASQVVREQGDATLANKIMLARDPDIASSITMLGDKLKLYEAVKSQADKASAPPGASAPQGDPPKVDKQNPDKQITEDQAFKDLLNRLLVVRQGLLRSGQYAGLWFQVRSPRLQKDNEVSKDEAWESGQREIFLKQVCVSWFEAQASTGRQPKDAKTPLDILDCPGLAEHFGEAPSHTETSTVGTKVKTVNTVASVAASASSVRQETDTDTTYITQKSTKPGDAHADHSSKSMNDDMRKFWDSSQLVWDSRLATAIWDVQMAAACGGHCTAPKDANAENASHPPLDLKAALSALQAALVANQAATKEASRHVDKFMDRLPSLGWRGQDQTVASVDKSQATTAPSKAMNTSFCDALLMPIGWVLTALMVSFGAPFWFDLLSKLINRRATGPRPDTAN